MAKDKSSRPDDSAILEVLKKHGISGNNFGELDYFKSDPSLIEQTVKHWNDKSNDERKLYYKQIDGNYHTIVEEFFDQADKSAERFREFSNKHIRWGKKMMWLTGGIALFNVILFYTAGQGLADFSKVDYPYINRFFGFLPLIAAIYAAFIAIFGKLETLQNYFDRAQVNREVREVFLDAARKYEMLWHVYVRPFGNSSKACANAAKLYRQIVLTDRVIRGKAKEFSQTKRSENTQSGGTS